MIHLTCTGYNAGELYCGEARGKAIASGDRFAHYVLAPREWDTAWPEDACPDCFEFCFGESEAE